MQRADVCVLTTNKETDIIIDTTASVSGQFALIEADHDLGDLDLNRAIAGFLAGYPTNRSTDRCRSTMTVSLVILGPVWRSRSRSGAARGRG